jgi:hypothetical protein
VQSLISAGIFTTEEVINMQLPLALAKKYGEAIAKLAESLTEPTKTATEKTEPVLTVDQKKVKNAVEKKTWILRNSRRNVGLVKVSRA